MKMARSVGPVLLVMAMVLAVARPVVAQTQEFVPEVGQPGKDVVWVPSPPETVEKMMEVGRVTPQDFLVDLGSGDGRNVIAAAKRGARGLGVEWNADMVELSKRLAAKEGVGDRAQFVQGDMFQADFSKATVLALFLLPSNLLQLRDKILNLQPGTRVVLNTFAIQDWTPDEQVTLQNCTSWCTVMLNIVPAKIGGTWQLPQGGELTLTQHFQMVSGTMKTVDGRSVPVTGRLRGTELTLSAEQREFKGTVNGNRIEGPMSTAGQASPVPATRVRERVFQNPDTRGAEGRRNCEYIPRSRGPRCGASHARVTAPDLMRLYTPALLLRRRERSAGTASNAAFGNALAARRSALTVDGSASRKTSIMIPHAAPKTIAAVASRPRRARRGSVNSNTSLWTRTSTPTPIPTSRPASHASGDPTSSAPPASAVARAKMRCAGHGWCWRTWRARCPIFRSPNARATPPIPIATPPSTSPRKWRPRYMRDSAISAIHTATAVQPRRFHRNNRARPTPKAVVSLTCPDGNP